MPAKHSFPDRNGGDPQASVGLKLNSLSCSKIQLGLRSKVVSMAKWEALVAIGRLLVTTRLTPRSARADGKQSTCPPEPQSANAISSGIVPQLITEQTLQNDSLPSSLTTAQFDADLQKLTNTLRFLVRARISFRHSWLFSPTETLTQGMFFTPSRGRQRTIQQFARSRCLDIIDCHDQSGVGNRPFCSRNNHHKVL